MSAVNYRPLTAVASRRHKFTCGATGDAEQRKAGVGYRALSGADGDVARDGKMTANDRHEADDRSPHRQEVSALNKIQADQALTRPVRMRKEAIRKIYLEVTVGGKEERYSTDGYIAIACTCISVTQMKMFLL